MSKVISIHPARKKSYFNVLHKLRAKSAGVFGLQHEPIWAKGDDLLQVAYKHPSIFKGWESFRSELEFE